MNLKMRELNILESSNFLRLSGTLLKGQWQCPGMSLSPGKLNLIHM